jgi:hypothetical protein
MTYIFLSLACTSLSVSALIPHTHQPQLPKNSQSKDIYQSCSVAAHRHSSFNYAIHAFECQVALSNCTVYVTLYWDTLTRTAGMLYAAHSVTSKTFLLYTAARLEKVGHLFCIALRFIAKPNYTQQRRVIMPIEVFWFFLYEIYKV